MLSLHREPSHGQACHTHDTPCQDCLALNLARETIRGSIPCVGELLAEGASVDGTMELRPIILAILSFNMTMIKFLVEHGADVNAPSHIEHEHVAGTRALHLAAGFGRIHIVRVLLQAGANPNAVNTNDATPMMFACSISDMDAARMAALSAINSSNSAGSDLATDSQNPDMATVGELLKAGADPLMTDNDGYLALHIAALKGNADLISMLLSAAPHTANQTGAHGYTPMFMAAAAGHATAVDRLLSAGVPATLAPLFGPCPIVEAVLQSNEEVVRVLIEKASDTVLDLLRQYPIGVIVAAVEQGHARILKQVITTVRDDEDQQLKLRRYTGTAGPVLHYAAGQCLPASVRLLLAEGADESALDDLGQRACDVVGTMDRKHPPRDCGIDPTLPRTRERHPVQEALILRLLEQGPAFRARSWAWPGGPSSSSADVAAAAVAAAAAAAADTVSKRAPHHGMLSVRLVRPKKGMKFFVKRICRHARKK